MNAAEAQEVKSLLMQSNDQYRQLSERHHLLDDRLHQLTERHFLSATEQLEEVTLKKQKLALKDQMERMALEYAKIAPASVVSLGSTSAPETGFSFPAQFAEN